MALSREPSQSGLLGPRQIRLALGGIRFHKDLIFEAWNFKPSIGLLAKDIDRLGIDIRSFKVPLTRSVKRVIIPSIRKNFEVGGRPDWEPLAEDTIRLRGGSAWPILVRSGALKRGATQFNIWSIGQTSATVRSLPDKVWYGVVHQAGSGGFSKYTKEAAKQLGKGAKQIDITRKAFQLLEAARGSGKKHAAVQIPQRQFILYQEEDMDRVRDVFYEWLVERAVAVGRFR